MKIRSIFSSTKSWLVMRADNIRKYFRETSVKGILTDLFAFVFFWALITSPAWNLALFFYLLSRFGS